MNLVVCTIQVLVFHFFLKADLECKILKEDKTQFLVNCSVDAKKNNYDGDYSRLLVSKENCIKE